MDLQRIEEAMKRLEPEIDKVAAIGKLQVELDGLRARLDEVVVTLTGTGTHLAESADSVRQSMETMKEQLSLVDQRLSQLARDVDERVAIQLANTTNRFEGFVREESRAIADRLELNHRELVQKIEKAEAEFRERIDKAAVDLEVTNKRRFRMLLFAAVAIVILVLLSTYLSIHV